MCERFLEMSVNTIKQRVVIPRDIWTDNTHEVVKVVVSGTDAAHLSNESLQKHLIDVSSSSLAMLTTSAVLYILNLKENVMCMQKA